MIKTFIIHLPDHKQSVAYANESFRSCKNKNFDVELFAGYYYKNIDNFKHIPDFMKKSRAEDFYKEQNTNRFLSKRSIFANGYSLWKKCIDINENIVVLEHDSICKRQWDFPEIDDILILNIESAFNQKLLKEFVKKNKKKFPNVKKGIHRYSSPFIYHRKNAYHGSFIMPGAAAYAISPKGAKKLIDSAEKYGWEQNDHFINTHNVNIDYVAPEYFTLKLPNLNLSFGV